MANFEQAYALTMGAEGGYANDPDDSGGETYKGITSRDWPNWEGWKLVETTKKTYLGTGAKLDETILSRMLAKDDTLQYLVSLFYKRHYWDINRLGEITIQAIANELFDTGVNMGTKTAAMYLQRSLNLMNNVQKLYPNITVDGEIGPVTLKLLNSHPYPKFILLLLNVMQGNRYIELAEKKESQKKFMRSWLSRVFMGSMSI